MEEKHTFTGEGLEKFYLDARKAENRHIIDLLRSIFKTGKITRYKFEEALKLIEK